MNLRKLQPPFSAEHSGIFIDGYPVSDYLVLDATRRNLCRSGEKHVAEFIASSLNGNWGEVSAILRSIENEKEVGSAALAERSERK